MSEERVQNEPVRRKRNRPAVLPTTEVMQQCFDSSLELDVAEGNASPDTVRTYRSRLTRYLEWCETQQLNPALADAENVKQFRRYLIERNLKPNTIGLTLTVIRRFYEAAVAKKLIKENPAVGIKPPRKKTDPDGEFTYLEKDELKTLLAAIPNDDSMMALRDRALIALMALQGPRGVELHNASVGDLIQTRDGWELRVGSKRSVRKIPLRPDLAKALWAYLDARERAGESLNSNSPLFLNLNWANPGQRLTRRGIRTIVDKYLEAAGLKNINGVSLSTHSLRHTAGTLGWEGGADLREIQELLGHADPKTTAIYTHVRDKHGKNPALGIDVDI